MPDQRSGDPPDHCIIRHGRRNAVGAAKSPGLEVTVLRIRRGGPDFLAHAEEIGIGPSESQPLGGAVQPD
jgi:hypothetical protein